jgi:adenylyltransferase/sulfurtransferase
MSRYERQVLLPDIGDAGQRRLAEASVLVIGAGGLGAPVLQYLAAAGVGKLGIMDGDTVSLSNLNRQILYGDDDIGKPKAKCASERLKALNGEIEIATIPEMLTDENAAETIKPYDVLALCTDSIKARKTANRACVASDKPFVDGAVGGFGGTVFTYIPSETACYECVHGHISQKREQVPILGAFAGWVGCAEALTVLRLLLGYEDPSRGALLFFDGKEMTSEVIPVAKNPNCPVCG